MSSVFNNLLDKLTSKTYALFATTMQKEQEAWMNEITAMRHIRFLKRMSLDDLHLLVGRRISQAKLSRVERKITIPSSEEKKIISRALREPVSKVFPSEEK